MATSLAFQPVFAARGKIPDLYSREHKNWLDLPSKSEVSTTSGFQTSANSNQYADGFKTTIKCHFFLISQINKFIK